MAIGEITRPRNATTPSALAAPIEPLSPKEQRVLSYFLKGYISKQIGAMIGNSDRTIETHKAHILRKHRACRMIDIVIAVLRAEAKAAYERGVKDGREGRQ